MAKANPFRFSTKYQDDETDIVMYARRPIRGWQSHPLEQPVACGWCSYVWDTCLAITVTLVVTLDSAGNTCRYGVCEICDTCDTCSRGCAYHPRMLLLVLVLFLVLAPPIPQSVPPSRGPGDLGAGRGEESAFPEGVLGTW